MDQNEVLDAPREFQVFAQMLFTEPSDPPLTYEELVKRTIGYIPLHGGEISTFIRFLDQLLDANYSDGLLARLWRNSEPRYPILPGRERQVYTRIRDIARSMKNQ